MIVLGKSLTWNLSTLEFVQAFEHCWGFQGGRRLQVVLVLSIQVVHLLVLSIQVVLVFCQKPLHFSSFPFYNELRLFLFLNHALSLM